MVPFAGNTLEVHGDLEVPMLTIVTRAKASDIKALARHIGAKDARAHLEVYREMLPTAVRLSSSTRAAILAELDACLDALFSNDKGAQALLLECYTALADYSLLHEDTSQTAVAAFHFPITV